MHTFIYSLGRPALRKRPYIDSRDLHGEPLLIPTQKNVLLLCNWKSHKMGPHLAYNDWSSPAILALKKMWFTADISQSYCLDLYGGVIMINILFGFICGGTLILSVIH